MRAFVFCGGDPVPAELWAGRAAPDLAVAADAGAETAIGAGWKLDALVGDLDSISASALEQVRESGAALETHPADKDSTDLALALRWAVRRGAEAVTVIGGGGGRMDHLLGNAAVICDPAWAGVEICWITARETAYPVHGAHPAHGELTLTAEQAPAGTVVSVLAVGGPAAGVTLRGLRWPLRSARLEAWSSLGISNLSRGGPVTVRVESGTALTVVNHPPRRRQPV